MLDEEVIDIIVEELSDFLPNYIMMTSFTHESFTTLVEDQKTIKFGNYSNRPNWKGKYDFNSKHSITKAGRTKLWFHFSFHKDEYAYAEQILRLLDGYVDVGLSNHSKDYSLHFTIDVGSKANFIKFFDKLVSEEL